MTATCLPPRLKVSTAVSSDTTWRYRCGHGGNQHLVAAQREIGVVDGIPLSLALNRRKLRDSSLSLQYSIRMVITDRLPAVNNMSAVTEALTLAPPCVSPSEDRLTRVLRFGDRLDL
jgi:hypothetical protein